MCRIDAVSDDEPRSIIDLLRERFGDRPFRVAEAIEAGASSSSLHRLRRGGQLESLGHGLLQLPGGGMGMLSGLAVVSTRLPGGTICLNSALSYWDLSDEVPEWVHIAVPRGAHRPVIEQPPTKVHVFDAETFEREREQARTDVGEPFWITRPNAASSTRYGCRKSWAVTSRCKRCAATWIGAGQLLPAWLNSPASSAAPRASTPPWRPF